MNTQYLLVVSDCKPGREAEYNDYYDHQHIPDVMEHQPEVVSAQRFGVEPQFGPAALPAWRFSTLYTIDTADMPGYLRRMDVLLKAGKLPPSDAAEPSTAAVFRLIPLGPAISRDGAPA